MANHINQHLVRVLGKIQGSVERIEPKLRPVITKINRNIQKLSCLESSQSQQQKSQKKSAKKTRRDEGVSWCKLAYWEERERVGAQYHCQSSSLEISSLAQARTSPGWDVLSLPALRSSNLRPSPATLRTRDKIGLGVLLSRDEAGVWLHNRTEVPLFVNSPTLDVPNSRTFSVFKIPPGYSMQIFNFELSAVYQRARDPAAYEGPYDPHAMRLSFAKGWGQGYSRQSVECCPCWLEILLNPDAL